MPVVTISFTEQELFDVAIGTCRKASDDILRLADIGKTPLVPGESVDGRRHQIAKLGKILAEAFIAVDEMFKEAAAARAVASDVTAGAPNPDNPGSN